jgi:hypothetical protein
MRCLAIAVVLLLFVTCAIAQIPPAPPACSAAGPANSGVARAGLLSRIESRGHQSSGQFIKGCFSHATQASASSRPRYPLRCKRGDFVKRLEPRVRL